MAQVALNWVICKGALPIPGAKNEEQALQNTGALGWRLTDEEVASSFARLGKTSSVMVAIARSETIGYYSTLFAEAGIKVRRA